MDTEIRVDFSKLYCIAFYCSSLAVAFIANYKAVHKQSLEWFW